MPSAAASGMLTVNGKVELPRAGTDWAPPPCTCHPEGAVSATSVPGRFCPPVFLTVTVTGTS